jgi:hypothetical protein
MVMLTTTKNKLDREVHPILCARIRAKLLADAINTQVDTISTNFYLNNY